MAAWEGDAEQLRRKRRTLTDVLWEAMQRGDPVTISVAGHVFAGSLRTVRNDLAVIETAEARVAVNVAVVEAVTFGRGGGGVSGDRALGSMRAYLGMLEVEGTEVRLVGEGLDLTGRVTVAAVDHLIVARATGGEAAVSIAAVGAVISGLDVR